jgi:hypothetical protein
MLIEDVGENPLFLRKICRNRKEVVILLPETVTAARCGTIVAVCDHTKTFINYLNH